MHIKQYPSKFHKKKTEKKTEPPSRKTYFHRSPNISSKTKGYTCTSQTNYMTNRYHLC